jgi:hypothetical protein
VPASQRAGRHSRYRSIVQIPNACSGFFGCKPDDFASAGYLFDSICGALQFFLVWHASFGVIFHDYSATSDSFVTLGHATAELGFLDRSWMLKTEFS